MGGEILMLGDTLIAEGLITVEQLTEALLVQEEERGQKGKVVRPLGDIIHEKYDIPLDEIESAFVKHCLPDILRAEIRKAVESDYLLEMEEINFDEFIKDIDLHVPHYYRQKTDLDRMDNKEGKMTFQHRKCLEYMLNGKANVSIHTSVKTVVDVSFFFTYKMIEKEISFNAASMMDAVRDPLAQLHKKKLETD